MTSWSYPTPADHARLTVEGHPADDTALLRRLGLATAYRTLHALTDACIPHTFVIHGELLCRR